MGIFVINTNKAMSSDFGLGYTTDFEHTIRDNSDYELTVDLSQSQMTLPY